VPTAEIKFEDEKDDKKVISNGMILSIFFIFFLINLKTQ